MVTERVGQPALPTIRVACGVLVDGPRILIARRPTGKVGAGKWEFPGGKIEAGETPRQALVRELDEELGIQVTQATPLARLRHAYRDRIIWLDTWRVEAFAGSAVPREGQELAWVEAARAPEYELLGSSWRVLAALRLPRHYAFTPPILAPERWLAQIPALPRGTWLRLRRPAATDVAYVDLARPVARACAAAGVALVVDRMAALEAGIVAAGLHLGGVQLARITARPVDHEIICFASVHDAAQLALAYARDVDAVIVSPLRATPSHPQAQGIGWDAFHRLAVDAGLPAYALGGVGPGDLETVRRHGGFGVAGISAYWSGSS
ncbi:MAG: Nudix family hydrolase [Nevskiaceae bacterium]|nr:MAG: Nudix family hydrolase [Nevskiaceae bacterium]TBR73396.1 MAG: Nudix family hydrolase [Nevskiaceae bacterium]